MSDTCRSCGAPIYWAITPEGKRMPLNPPPRDPEAFDAKLNVESWRDTDGVLRTGPAHPDAVVRRTTSHFATCREADQWRKP